MPSRGRRKQAQPPCEMPGPVTSNDNLRWREKAPAPRSKAATSIFDAKISGFRVPLKGIPGGGLRLPALSMAQIGFVCLGSVIGGMAVYSAVGEGILAPPTSPTAHKKKRLPRLLSIGPLATDALVHGSPGSMHDVLLREAYVAAHDRSRRHPAWTAEHLTRDNLQRRPDTPSRAVPIGENTPNATSERSRHLHEGSEQLKVPQGPTQDAEGESPIGGKADSSNSQGGDRTKSEFQEDPEVPEIFRAKLADYVGSGYDRGHMVAAADAKRNQQAMNETFKLTNIAPQVGEGFNRHYWAWLESFCRNLTNSFQDVYIFTVPLYLPKLDTTTKKWTVTYEVIGPPGLAPSVSVPTHFAKVILTRHESGESALGAFVLPNAKIPDFAPLEGFSVPVNSVERASGFLFFNETVKSAARALCEVTRCDVVRRFYDEAGNMTVLEAPQAQPKTPNMPSASSRIGCPAHSGTKFQLEATEKTSQDLNVATFTANASC